MVIYTKFEKKLCFEVCALKLVGLLLTHYIICHVHATVPAGKLCLLVNLTNHNHFHSQSDNLEDQDAVLCFTCAKASSEKKLNWSNNAEAAFISESFSNWKHATIKFSSHEGSRCHKEAVLKLILLPSTTKDIGESLSQQHMKEKMERRQCFLKILSRSRFLA